MAKEKYRGRVHMILLYADNEQHLEVLSKIQKSYDYAGAQHTKDTWTEEDEKQNSEHKKGQVKKAHFHIVLRTQNATWNTALAKELGLEERFIEQARSIDNALQYLIHYNDTNKTQYTLEDVFGTLKTRLIESINKCEKSEGEKVVDLIEYIEKQDSYITIKAFANYCAKNGYWAEFRRSASIFIKILEEHNSKFNLTAQKPTGAYETEIQQARFEGYVQGHSDKNSLPG